MAQDFNQFDFDPQEFDIVQTVAPAEPPVLPLPKIVLNAYKAFKAIRNGETYYMSGKDKWR